MTEIKICGITREEDLRCINRVRPEYIGFILNFPRSRRNISPEQALRLRKALEPGIRAVGVIVDQPLETALELAGAIGLDILQLHGAEDEAYIQELRRKAGLPVWKAFRIHAPEDLGAAERCGADRVLLDGGTGSGETFDWSLTGRFSRPFILAGGLTPDNIGAAIRQVRPAAVDVSSGVETDGRKDAKKIEAFIAAVRRENSNE